MIGDASRTARDRARRWILVVCCVAVGGLATATAVAQGGAQSETVDPRDLAERGAIDDAIAAWRAKIAERPDDVTLRLALIDLLLEKHYTNDALDETQAAIKQIPRDYELLLRMTRACQQKGEALRLTQGGGTSARSWFQDVVRWGGEASKIAPKKREPHAMRGMALFGLGRVEEAEKVADTLIEIAPEHPGGWILRGECLFDRYQVAKGDKKADVAKRLHPRVHAAFEKASELDDARVIPWRRLGDLAAWEADTDKALSYWTEALARDPERGAPLTWLRENIDAARRTDMYAKAIERFDALGTQPADGKARLLWLLGVLDFGEKRYEECRKRMQACYDLRNDWLNALFYHGLASWKLDDQDMGLLAFGLFAQKDAVQLAKSIRDSLANADVNKELVKYYADLAFKRGNAPMSRDLNHTVALLEDDAARWNNYAFLCRETAQYEESWRAYQKALGHAPEDPQLLNDAAVILQYHLLRDLDEAASMYADAIKFADAELAKKSVTPEDRKRFEQAKTDAGNNLAALKLARAQVEKAGKDKKR